MATALSIINGAADLIGIKAQGETLSAADAIDGLRRLNNMVSGWRTQFGTVSAIVRNVFALTANQQTYTIGLGGDFNVPRPVTIEAAGLWLNALGAAALVAMTRSGSIVTVTLVGHGYAVGDQTNISGASVFGYNGLQTVTSVPSSSTFTFTVQGTPTTPATASAAPVTGQPVEIPRPVITDSGYQAIQIKNMPNQQVTVVYYNPTYPFGTVFLWPLPNTAQNQLVLYLQTAFEGFADLTTNYDYPDLPGYAEALEYNLAARLCAPYARPDVPSVIAMAATSLGLIKRANNKLVDLPSDAALLTGDRRAGYNINTGTGG